VAVVSGAVFGGINLTLFTWIGTQFPGNTIVTWFARLGPGLSGIAIGRQPSGVIPTVGEDLRAQNARKRAARLQETPPPPSEPPAGIPNGSTDPNATAPTSVASPGA
jgi:hypothetical protein